MAVIDESEEYLQHISDQAKTLGHDVRFVAANSADAIRALGVHEVDVLISDQVMPGADAHDLMREIRRAHPELRVVAIAGGYLEHSMLPTSSLHEPTAVLPETYQLAELDEAIAGAA